MERSTARVTVLVAPAGYGKTILARQWANASGLPTAWVTADRTDDDPLVLTAAVVEALRAIIDVSALAALLDGPVRRARPAEVLAALGAAVADAPPFALIVDDGHLIESEASLATIDRLVDCLPDGGRLVVTGRSVPRLRLARRRLAEPVLELGVDDLAFSASETDALLRDRLGAQLDDSVVAELFERTEGWPAGLQLAAMALDGHPDPHAALQTLLSGDVSFVDYLEGEMLSGLSEADRDVLLRTSVLERLNPSLCRAVTRVDDSAQLLDRLVETGNLFVVPLEHPATYRYHHLFGELLLQRLRRTEPALEPELRRRAAVWMLGDGDAESAVRHALATGDFGFAADVVHRLVFPAIEQGDRPALERWLAGFPPEEVRRRGPLLVARGWVAVSRGETGELAEILGLLDDAVDREHVVADPSLEVAAAALRLLSGADGVKQLVSCASIVIDAGPSGSPWWGLAMYLRTVGEYLLDADDDGIARFDRAERASRGDGAIHAVALAQAGFVRLVAQDPSGHAMVDAAAEELRGSGAEEFTLAAMVFTVKAYADAERGRAEASRASAGKASAMIETVGGAVPRGVAHQSLILADAALLRHDVTAALEELARARRMLPREPDAVRLHDWADRVARQASARRTPAGGFPVTALSPAELRVLEQLRTHLSLEEIGTRLYISRNTVKSHTIAIYRKLGVSGRSAAVERAQELSLLDAV